LGEDCDKRSSKRKDKDVQIVQSSVGWNLRWGGWLSQIAKMMKMDQRARDARISINREFSCSSNLNCEAQMSDRDSWDLGPAFEAP
jgi:hypothetical protein